MKVEFYEIGMGLPKLIGTWDNPEYIPMAGDYVTLETVKEEVTVSRTYSVQTRCVNKNHITMNCFYEEIESVTPTKP